MQFKLKALKQLTSSCHSSGQGWSQGTTQALRFPCTHPLPSTAMRATCGSDAAEWVPRVSKGWRWEEFRRVLELVGNHSQWLWELMEESCLSERRRKKKKKSLKHPSPKCCDTYFLIKCYIKLSLANYLCVSIHEIYLTASPPFFPPIILFSA